VISRQSGSKISQQFYSLVAVVWENMDVPLLFLEFYSELEEILETGQPRGQNLEACGLDSAHRTVSISVLVTNGPTNAV
jgi:hypothetical protein